MYPILPLNAKNPGHCCLRAALAYSSQLSQAKCRLLHGRLERIGEASADTAATETYYMKGYYNLEEETIKVKI